MIRKLHVFQYNTLVVNGRYPARGAVELLAALHAAEIPFLIVTEQSNRTRQEIITHMMKMGFYHMSAETVYTSTMAAADWIARQYPERARAAMIGGRGMRETLAEAGFEIVTEHPDWLFSGFDRNATYTDYSYGLSLLRSGAALISTDSSRTRSGEAGEGIGPGALCRMLEYAAHTRALEFGRPSVITAASALKYVSCQPCDAVYVGDHFELDLIPALKCRMDTALVTGGESGSDAGMSQELHPKWIVDDLFGLAR